MLSRMLRFAILLAVVAAIVEALRRLAQPEPEPAPAAPTPWTPLEPTSGQDNGASASSTPAEASVPEAESAASAEATPAPPSAEASWIDPDTDGACPASHPLKAKDSSKIVHQPGGLSYDRTHADRCYVDLATAEADGYRAAKR